MLAKARLRSNLQMEWNINRGKNKDVTSRSLPLTSLHHKLWLFSRKLYTRYIIDKKLNGEAYDSFVIKNTVTCGYKMDKVHIDKLVSLLNLI
jgi:hypothetical protein